MFLARLAFAVAAFAQTPSITELAREAMENKKKFDRDLTEYTYDFRYNYTFYDAKGKVTKTIDVTGETFQSSKRNVNVDLTWNGAAIEPKKIEKSRMAAAKALQDDFEKRLAARAARPSDASEGPEYGTGINGVRMEIYRVLRECRLENLRTDTRAGREHFVFDFRPREARSKTMAHLESLRGTIWIDAKARMVSYWTAWLPDGARFYEEEQTPMPDGAWLPKRVFMDLHAAGKLFPGKRLTWTSEMSKHNRFNVGVEQVDRQPLQ